MHHIRPAFDRRLRSHYVEMVVSMYLGMVVLGMPLSWLAGAAGIDTADVDETAPALLLLEMAVIMTVPMVAVMLRRSDECRCSHDGAPVVVGGGGMSPAVPIATRPSEPGIADDRPSAYAPWGGPPAAPPASRSVLVPSSIVSTQG